MSMFYCHICENQVDSDFWETDTDDEGQMVCANHKDEAGRRLTYVSKGHWKYGQWDIDYEMTGSPSRHFDYTFSHDNHDGENGLSGASSSLSLAIDAIHEIEETL